MTAGTIYLHRRCRACGDSILREVLQLGPLYLNAFPAHPNALNQRVPLTLMVCTGCGLVQLDRSVPADWMYREYWYRSGVNEMMVRELHDIVREARACVDVGAVDYVLDIGANDGTLLSYYAAEHGHGPRPFRMAVEPALNLAGTLRAIADVVVHDYFPCVEALSPKGQRYKIITAVACAYDTDTPVAFFRGLYDLLAPGGVAIVQFQDFGQQLESSAFDTICHEHLLYYTLWSLSHILRETSLTVQRVTQTPINGGSLRVVLRRAADGIFPEPSVGQQLVRESALGLATPDIRTGIVTAFETFARRVRWATRQISETLQYARDAGATIDVYGASTKGNILLQVLGLGAGQIRQAIDRSPEKHGRYTVTGIPIVGEEEARAQPADVWLSPIWQFRESVLAREQWYLEQGGTIVFPLPRVEVVREDWPRPVAQAGE